MKIIARIRADWNFWLMQRHWPKLPEPCPSVDILRGCLDVLWPGHELDVKSELYGVEIKVWHRTAEDLIQAMRENINSLQNYGTLSMRETASDRSVFQQWMPDTATMHELTYTLVELNAALIEFGTFEISSANRILLRVAQDIHTLTVLWMNNRA